MAIPPGSIRANAQWLVNKLARTDASARSIMRTLREQGLGYRQSDVMADVRHYHGLERRQPAVRSVRLDRMFSDRLIEPTDLNIRRRYRFTFDVEYLDPETGDLQKSKRSLTTSHLRTRGELEERMREVMEDEQGPSNLEVVSVHIAEIEQRRGTGRSEAMPGAPWD